MRARAAWERSVMFSCNLSPLTCNLALQRLEEFEQGRLLGRAQTGAVDVAAVVVATDTGVVAEAGPLGLGAIGHEADVGVVVDGVASVEDLWARLRRLQQIAQGRHRAVVQV